MHQISSWLARSSGSSRLPPRQFRHGGPNGGAKVGPAAKADSPPMLDLSNLHITFNAGTSSEVQALRGLSLSIAPGDFVSVIGANGAGKSTLFNAIAGTIPVDLGKIVLHSKDVT